MLKEFWFQKKGVEKQRAPEHRLEIQERNKPSGSLILEKSDAFPRSLFLQVLLGRELCAVSDLEEEAKKKAWRKGGRTEEESGTVFALTLQVVEKNKVSAAAMGSGQTASNAAVYKKILVSYSYVAVWIFLSFTVIVYNKYILDRKMYNWPFPISLTMIHMGFCSFIAFFLVRVFKLVEPLNMTRELFISSVVPIGALYSISLWLSNSAYIYLSVSFIQMLKALMPVAVYSTGVIAKKDTFNSKTMTNMVAISVGVAIAAYGEARFNLFGVMLQLGAVVVEATRLVMIQILLTSKGITLNPISTLYYVAPCCFVFLSIPWMLVEYPVLMATSSFKVDFFVFGMNSLAAFALNLAVFLLVGKTSALTMNVAGVVKDWLLIAFSWSVIMDRVTPINLMGYAVAFIGVCFYNHAKLQALKAKELQKQQQLTAVDEEVGLLEQKFEKLEEIPLPPRKTDTES
jgi:drug/metabolite transporter (DMT)-like permease